METKQLPYIKAPHFASGVATGLTISGPSPDGHLHLSFFHDTFNMIGEAADVETKVVDGVEMRRMKFSGQTSSEPAREVIATISLNTRALTAMRDAISQLLEAATTHNPDLDVSA